MRKLLFIFLFYLNFSWSATPQKRMFAAGSSQMINVLGKADKDDDRVGIKRTAVRIGMRHTSPAAHRSPAGGETAKGGAAAGGSAIPLYTAAGGVNNHHQGIRHSGSSCGRSCGGDAAFLITILVLFCTLLSVAFELRLG